MQYVSNPLIQTIYIIHFNIRKMATVYILILICLKEAAFLLLITTSYTSCASDTLMTSIKIEKYFRT